MRVSLNWLEEFVELPTRNPKELSRTLAMLGHEVDGVEHIEADWTKVKVAKVETIDPHPDADKVRVCTVTTDAEPITVVCGAWNFEAGALVAFAEPGAVLPGDFEIGVRTIRGVESHGMICSEKELALGEDAEGIMVLDQGRPGQPLEEMLSLPDVIFDLGITTNRPDSMSVYGIARDLAAWYQAPLKTPHPRPDRAGSDPAFSVDIQDPLGNPRFVAEFVEGVEVAPSPLWMRQRLRNAGIRPISNLVDVTNYVMLEMGQPLHVFDADKVAGDELVVRRAEPGETLVTLDGVERKLTQDDLVICDDEGPTSLAGTMGGERSEVSDTTVSTIIEAAAWHPPTVLGMSYRHGLRSEASSRFERGVDPNLPPVAAARAAELILELAGGNLRAQGIDEIARPHQPTLLQLEVGEVNRILGDRFDRDSVTGFLERLGFAVSGDEPLKVEVPSFRPDVTRPVDLIEEVARLADYDTFGERLRVGTGGGLTSEQRFHRRLRETLASVGYSQAMSLPFVSPGDIDAFDPPESHELTAKVPVKNPLSEEEAELRTSLLPGLLSVLRHNRNRGRDSVAVFEQGRVFHSRPHEEDPRLPAQPLRLAVAATGVVGPAALDGTGPVADIHAATALVRHLAASLGIDVALEQSTAPGFHPTRTALVTAGGQPVGHVGEIHPLTARAFDIEARVAAAELDMERLFAAVAAPEYRPVSPYPPADFDLSFEVPLDLPAADLVAAVEGGGGEIVEDVSVFDEFTGGSLPEGTKALAVRVRLRAPDRTLKSEEIGELRNSMIESASGAGASLRGGS